ncbi:MULTISPECIES: anti-phage protein KwaA [Aliiglaciecola]|uniref:anti-phage protein KwaA n=1 Tax=Aliiglaciecola TaxID=1406885 RepID=UPI001C0A555C|nr:MULTISPECIES: anti-phage protein KwaA [Aliiglaciecola]MBU2878732.1 hypothetical protein [Aliiglaciecola lipolytica]MDO6711371.1 anti-phage protein KwaA [Aliiglaciecola sp. 2_MG-2023]MDO6752180.1 anti-phage protein KwaA [Aliiglaciecola sp. 1_MG-2023]
MIRRKFGLYIISLWLLFLLVIIITAKIPICWGDSCHFVGIENLNSSIIVPAICVVCLIWGGYEFKKFDFAIKGSTNIPFKLVKVESINYEHLTFLATYIIPLVTFDFESTRYLIVLALLLVFMGVIYIKTDLFYANPSLALLGFHIYKADGDFKNHESRQNIIIITRCKLKSLDRVSYIKLDERIYYGAIVE